METKPRRLVSIRRHVPADRIPEYAELYAALHHAAAARGAHAWAFASADHRDTYIEFLEFGDDSDVRNDTATVAAIQALTGGNGADVRQVLAPVASRLEAEAPVVAIAAGWHRHGDGGQSADRRREKSAQV